MRHAERIIIQIEYVTSKPTCIDRCVCVLSTSEIHPRNSSEYPCLATIPHLRIVWGPWFSSIEVPGVIPYPIPDELDGVCRRRLL